MKLTFDAGKHVPFDLTDEQVSILMSHEAVVAHVWKIGLKNILQDCHASIVQADFKTESEWLDAKRKKAELKLGALMIGDCRVSSGERKEKVDDFTTFARKYVLSLLSKEKRKAFADLPDKGISQIDAIFEKNAEKMRPIVEKLVADAIRAAEEKEALAKEFDLDI